MDIKKQFTTITTFSKIAALFILIAFPFAGFYLGYQYGKTAQPLVVSSTPTTSPRLIGGDKDEHGCLIAAGYSWCAEKNKCLRSWEEQCFKKSNLN